MEHKWSITGSEMLICTRNWRELTHIRFQNPLLPLIISHYYYFTSLIHLYHHHHLIWHQPASTMAFTRLPLLITASISLASPAASFSPIPSNVRHALPTQLFDVIQGEAIDSEALDENLGGVGLAKRCAIKISGTAKKGGNADCDDVFKNLVRYEKVQTLSESEVTSAMSKFGCKLVANGMGKELYYFPDDSARYEDRVIELAPTEAAKDALSKAESVGDAKYLVVNFLGGDDLIYGEVKDACDLLVAELDISDSTKIIFNSVSFKDFEDGACSVTVIASAGQSGADGGIENSIAKGEAYVYDGKWYTVTKEDITTATE